MRFQPCPCTLIAPKADAINSSVELLAGIVLFTHHKYQKAISSSPAEPVDSHGRPIRLSRSEEEGEGEESVPLTSMGRDEEERGSSREGGFLGGLFVRPLPSLSPSLTRTRTRLTIKGFPLGRSRTDVRRHNRTVPSHHQLQHLPPRKQRPRQPHPRPHRPSSRTCKDRSWIRRTRVVSRFFGSALYGCIEIAFSLFVWAFLCCSYATNARSRR